MRVSLLCIVTSSLLASSAAVSPAFGQWTLGLEVGADRYWGGSVETGGEERSFRPYRPTIFGVGLERMSGRVRAGLRLVYIDAGLALEGAEAAVVGKGVFKVYSASPELSYRIATVGLDNQLLLRVGPLFEVWDIIDEDSRTRAGAQGAVSLGIPLGGHFAGTLLAGAAVIPSPFEADELLPGYELRALWRRRFSVGLQYRL